MDKALAFGFLFLLLPFSSEANESMKCAVANRFGRAKDVVTMSTAPMPVVKPGSGNVLVKVHACSFSPSDYRMMSGETDLIKKPKAWPYIPGGDVCGTVMEVDPDDKKGIFKAGDCIVGTWDLFGIGGLAEYTLVSTKNAALLPPAVDPVVGAAMANSASHAVQVADASKAKTGDRVLVLGGSGGVGTILLQLLKSRGAHVTATSSDTALLKDLGADEAVNYKTQDWWDAPAIKGQAFDVVIDCAEGSKAWKKACSTGILRRGGLWIAVVLQDWHIRVKAIPDMFSLLVPGMLRSMSTSVTSGFGARRYKMHLGEANGKTISDVMQMITESKIKPILDKASPHPFTKEGVIEAMTLHEDRKGKGKIVVKISE